LLPARQAALARFSLSVVLPGVGEIVTVGKGAMSVHTALGAKFEPEAAGGPLRVLACVALPAKASAPATSNRVTMEANNTLPNNRLDINLDSSLQNSARRRAIEPGSPP